MSLGLFESQRLIFAFHLTTMIMRHDGKLPEEELDFFRKGSTTISEGETKPEALSWIPDSGWNDLFKLSAVSPAFQGLRESVLAEPQVSATCLFKVFCRGQPHIGDSRKFS